MAEPAEYRKALDQFSDWRWRLNNLYFITDKDGRRVRFTLNPAQAALFDDMWYLNVVLKARQFGFTTFIQIFMLDACLFNANVRAGTIAHTLADARTIFRDKVKYPYENLPEGLRRHRSVVKDSADELMLSNNSSLRVGTSLRSGTLQYLHVSEYGKLCAKFPEKAKEVRTGALNTIQAGQVAFIESTAEGQEGHFHELCREAQSVRRTGARLSPLDFRFHFFPWHRSPDYALDPEGIVIPDTYARYFEALSAEHGIALSDAQKAWYVKKAATQQEDMKREYPSTADEAFEASVEGAYYGGVIARAELEGRIGAYPALPDLPVLTAWDIGVGDATAIWFFQVDGPRIRFFAYYENHGEGAPHYAAQIRERERAGGWRHERGLFPHDARVKEWGSGRTRIEELVAARLRPQLVTRSRVDDGINAVRRIFRACVFDEAGCTAGLKALRAYRKEWDDAHGHFSAHPRHDWASHGADAFRTFAMGYRDAVPAEKPESALAALLRKPTLDEMMADHDGNDE